MKNDKLDKFKYFAIKGACLLSKNPEKIGSQILNMIRTTIMIENTNHKIILPTRILPVKHAFPIEHRKAIYLITQSGRWQVDKELLGCLSIQGVEYGKNFEVSYELSWEGIWKVIGVSIQNLSKDDQNKEVKRDWLISNKVDFAHFGGSSYEDEYNSLLFKVTSSSPSHAMVELKSTGIVNEEGSPPVKENSRGATNNGGKNGIHKRKRGIIIQPKDIIVSTGLKKIKLESDWVNKAVKKENIFYGTDES